MRMRVPSESELEFLRSMDTPTVCNLVEIVAPERLGHGYTVKHLHCPFPELPPMVGFARTVTFKAKDAVPLGHGGYMQKRLDYLDYVAGAPRPSVMVMEDLDGEHVGYGASGARCSPMCTKRLAVSASSQTAPSATSR